MGIEKFEWHVAGLDLNLGEQWYSLRVSSTTTSRDEFSAACSLFLYLSCLVLSRPMGIRWKSFYKKMVKCCLVGLAFNKVRKSDIVWKTKGKFVTESGICKWFSVDKLIKGNQKQSCVADNFLQSRKVIMNGFLRRLNPDIFCPQF